VSASDFFWIALGYFLAALASAVLGVAGTIWAFLRMHNNSLPPKA
jgi:hypothetical protein